MTENKNGKVDPVVIRELISQGIPMKRKESEINILNLKSCVLNRNVQMTNLCQRIFQESQEEKDERLTKAIMSRFSSVATL